jgi:glycosyltransferase involved in cell wall biosynthesis
MQQVLVISYIFPPMGGVGVQRTLKFVKYLPQFGWEAHVLTVQPPKTGLRDESLLKEIPSTTSITHTAALLLPPQLPWRVRDFISRWLLTVDEQVGWLPFAVRAGERIIKENPVEVIYSTSAPYSSHLIARQLHQRTHIPWVADFRDPWIGNFNLRFPTPIHRKVVQRLERLVVRDADRIIVVSPPMGQSFCERIPGISAGKISWIPNGFDAQDFSAARPMKRDRDHFYLVYTGSFYARGVTANPILSAIQMALNKGLISRQRICVQLVGNIGKSTQKWISELGLTEIVETPGYVSHEQSLAYLLAADALLLVIGDSPDSSMVYTGKVFEYLGAGKPILCLAKDGVASNLIRDTRAGIIVPPDDISQITQSLGAIYQQWQNGRLSIEPDRKLIQTFERRYLTGQLDRIFTEITGKTA